MPGEVDAAAILDKLLHAPLQGVLLVAGLFFLICALFNGFPGFGQMAPAARIPSGILGLLMVVFIWQHAAKEANEEATKDIVKNSGQVLANPNSSKKLDLGPITASKDSAHKSSHPDPVKSKVSRSPIVTDPRLNPVKSHGIHTAPKIENPIDPGKLTYTPFGKDGRIVKTVEPLTFGPINIWIMENETSSSANLDVCPSPDPNSGEKCWFNSSTFEVHKPRFLLVGNFYYRIEVVSVDMEKVNHRQQMVTYVKCDRAPIPLR